MNRRKAREIALCLVFEKDYHKDTPCGVLFERAVDESEIYEIYKSLWSDAEKTACDEELDYIKNVFFGVYANLEVIDTYISDASVAWQNSRISKIAMAVLRVAVYEMIYMPEVPVSVSINEAVELSKKYDLADAFSFVNGVLGAVAKSIRNE